MKQIAIILAFLFPITFSFGQQFIVVGNDTLPHKDLVLIQIDTVFQGSKTYYPGDTILQRSCHTFEKVNGKIVNVLDKLCLHQGLWIIKDSLGNYSIGNYENNNKVGIWKYIDQNGRLLEEKEQVSFGKEVYEVKKIDYTSGRPITVVNKPVLAFYVRNNIAILIILFFAFFGRVFINNRIYNIENGTNLSPIYGPFLMSNFEHSLLCTFTLWFINYSPRSKQLVIISNTMTIIAVSIFIITLIILP